MKSLFDSCLSYKLLQDPVTLACGNTVCKEHLVKLLLNKSEEKFCLEKHYMPEKGFVVNKQIQKVLDTNFNSVNIDLAYLRIVNIYWGRPDKALP